MLMSAFPVVYELNGIQRSLVVMCAGSLVNSTSEKSRRWIKHKDTKGVGFNFADTHYHQQGAVVAGLSTNVKGSRNIQREFTPFMTEYVAFVQF